jgi:hypothetical protein
MAEYARPSPLPRSSGSGGSSGRSSSGAAAVAPPDLRDVAARLAQARFVCVAACHVAKPPPEGGSSAPEDMRVLAVGYSAGEAGSPELVKVSATPPFSLLGAWKTCVPAPCVLNAAVRAHCAVLCCAVRARPAARALTMDALHVASHASACHAPIAQSGGWRACARARRLAAWRRWRPHHAAHHAPLAAGGLD